MTNQTVILLRQIRDSLRETGNASDESKPKLNKFGKEVNAMGVAITRANKRTAIFNATLKNLSNQAKPKKFELFNPKTLMEYRKAGGSVFEFAAEFLTNSAEDVRILGFEANKFKRVFFGFIPGSFAFFNRSALFLQFVGSISRTLFPKVKTGIESTQEAIAETNEETTKMSKTLGMVGKILTLTKKDIPSLSKTIRTSKLGTFFGLDTAKNSAGRRISRGLREGETAGQFVEGKTPFQKKRKEFLEGLKKIKFTDVIKSIGLGIGKIVFKVGMFFLGFLAFVTGLYLILKLIGPSLMKAFETTKKVFLFGLSLILPAISDIWSGLKSIWNAAFGGGSLTDLINGLVSLTWGILQLGIAILLTTGGALLTFIGGTLYQIGVEVKDRIKDIGKDGKLALFIGVVVGAIAFFFNAPLWLTALLVFLTFKAVKILKDEGLKGLKDALFRIDIVKDSTKKVKKFFGGIKEGFTSRVSKLNKQIGGGFELGSGINIAGSYADGGLVRKSGIQLVGERGAELIRLNAGSRVYNNRQTREMMGSTVNNFNITINAKDTSKTEMRRVADEIGKMVSTKITRRVPFSNLM